MVGQAVLYQRASGDVVTGIVTHEYAAQNLQPDTREDVAGVPDPDALERARAGRRQVNVLYVNPDPAAASAHGRQSVLAQSVPHRDHHDPEIDKAGYWYEVGE